MSERSHWREDHISRSGPTQHPPDPVLNRRTRTSSTSRRPPLPSNATLDPDLDPAATAADEEYDGATCMCQQATPAKTSVYKERVERKAANWDVFIERSRASYIEDYPLARSIKQASFNYHVQLLQESITNAWKKHPCTHLEEEFDQSCLKEVETRRTIYLSHAGHGHLHMPLWDCELCNQRFSPNPITFGCFPSSPVAPHYWVDLDLHHQFSELAMKGTSCDGRLTIIFLACMQDSYMCCSYMQLSSSPFLECMNGGTSQVVAAPILARARMRIATVLFSKCRLEPQIWGLMV
jgi:hypothetical protein